MPNVNVTYTDMQSAATRLTAGEHQINGDLTNLQNMIDIARQVAGRDAGVPHAARPFRVDVLPARITFADAWRLRTPGTPAGPLWAMVGVGGDELTAVGPELAAGVPVFIAAGRPKSGRSTVLVAMARSLLASGAQLVLVTPRPSPLRSPPRPGSSARSTGRGSGPPSSPGRWPNSPGPAS